MLWVCLKMPCCPLKPKPLASPYSQLRSMKAEIEHNQFINDCESLLSTQDSGLQDTWENLYEGKSVSFLGIIDNLDKRHLPTIKVMISWYAYHTFYDDYAYIPCLEVVLLPPLESDVKHFEPFYASGILKSCERIRSIDNESGCASILRIFLESGNFDSSSPSDDQYSLGLGYTCN